MVACLLPSCVQTVLCHAFVPLIRQESQIYDLTQLGYSLLAFRVDAGEVFNKHHIWTYLQSNNKAYLSLRLTRIKAGGSFQNHWSTSVSYQTTSETPNMYVVILQLDSFHIFNYEETDWYTGWMAAADIGGFAFFLYILHFIVMTVLNVVLENNSKFLAPSAPRAQYNQL